MADFNGDSLDNSGTGRVNPLDPQEFKKQGHMMIDFLADYYRDIEHFPVRRQVEPGYLHKLLPEAAPHTPDSMEDILRDIQTHIIPGLTHWQSPNFFAFFSCCTSIPGFLGEMLSTGFNVVPFSWMSSPAATELECIVMDWMGNIINLPQPFLFSGNGGGVMYGTTCEGILCTLIAARDRVLNERGHETISQLVVYGSDQTHCSLQKAAHIAGIFPPNFRVIKTFKTDYFALLPESFGTALRRDRKKGLIPLYLCVTVGTTSTNAVDPVASLCNVAKEHGVWVHVDAAYAGSACICPEYRHFIDGVENVDSISFNAHKWLLTPIDCCCLWLKDPVALTNALRTDPEYLRNKTPQSLYAVDYKDWQITLARRFRAIKLWLVLRYFGVANLRQFIRTHIRMAKHLEALVVADKRFEIVTPITFALVCFRLQPPPTLSFKFNRQTSCEDDIVLEITNDLTSKLLESVNASGSTYMTHAIVGGFYMIRFAVGATLTEERHVDAAWKVVQEHAAAILDSFDARGLP